MILRYASSSAAAFAILTGCVRESACSTSVNLEVRFAIDLEMEHNTTKVFQAEGGTGQYIVEIFEHGSNVPLTRFVAADQSILNGENCIQAVFPLSPARYTVAAWVDYFDRDGCFYDAADLSAIKINPDYHGCCDSDNAFAGIAEIDLTAHRNQPNAHVVKTIAMECPFAKIRVIATDVENFLMRAMAKGNTRAADISSFTVNFTYSGFLPTSFDVFRNNPNGVSTGIAFTSQPVLLPEQEYLLGYDYVLVNGGESSVLLDLAVADGNGDAVNSVSEIRIPVARGKVTTVRGEFLTGSYASGVAIDPGFGGEINIILD